MKSKKLKEEDIIGFDVQVNDVDKFGGRVGIIAWNEIEDITWQNPSSFGNLKLEK